MSKTTAFSQRNLKELIRDPLSYMFCLGFPLVMLIVMTLVNNGIESSTSELPPGVVSGAPTIFQIDKLAGGIAVFGLTFLMLFTCLTVSKDRSGAFLMRLYATPMRSGNFIAGYMLPTFVLGIIQVVITLAASFVIALVKGVDMSIGGLALSAVVLIPTIVMFIALGVLFGTLFSDKSAPGLCSIVISLASFLGGIWFDADSTGGFLKKLCDVLPFIHSVKAARMVCALDFDGILPHIGITSAYTLVITVLAIVVFKRKMKADLG